MADFLDFHVIVNKIAGERDGRYVTAVVEAPVSRFGQTFGQFTLEKTDPLYWSDGVGPLYFKRDAEQRFRLERGDGQVNVPEETIGRALFDLIFPENSAALNLLGRSCIRVGPHRYLRLKLELHSDLANLPWEMMECPLAGSWAEQIASARLSVIRYLGEVSEPPVPVRSGCRPSVIVVRADPQDCASKEVTESFIAEFNQLQNALARLGARVSSRVIAGKGTLNQLKLMVEELERNDQPVVGIHFIGHGWAGEQGSFFAGEREDGSMHPIYVGDLRKALDRAHSINWVILNACWVAAEPIGCPLSGLATSLSVLKNIPTVIAYKRPVETKVAEHLAALFYSDTEKPRPIEDVIRSMQLRHDNPGGLVILARSIEGRIQNFLHFAEKDASPVGEGAEAERGAHAGAGRQREGAPPRPRHPLDERQPERRAAAEAPPRAPAADLGRMVQIPAGAFKRGLSKQQIESLLATFKARMLNLDQVSARRSLSEEQEEEVELSAFSIDVTPVTNAQFSLFVEATGHVTQAEYVRDPENWRIHNTPEKANHPVVFVSLGDAEAFCRWAGKRLPTADEWKKAYRGPEDRIYPWGNTFDLRKCNTAETRRGDETTPVDRFPNGASWYGCYDMLGNVEEWTGTTVQNGNIILGGSWAMSCEVYGLPVLHRLAPPNFYANDTGFRCAKDTD